MLVDEVQEANDRSGEMMEVDHSQTRTIKSRAAQRSSLGHKTLAKTIARFRNYRVYWAFLTWREHKATVKSVAGTIRRKFIVRWLNLAKSRAFSQWRTNATVKFRRRKMMAIEEERG